MASWRSVRGDFRRRWGTAPSGRRSHELTVGHHTGQSRDARGVPGAGLVAASTQSKLRTRMLPCRVWRGRSSRVVVQGEDAAPGKAEDAHVEGGVVELDVVRGGSVTRGEPVNERRDAVRKAVRGTSPTFSGSTASATEGVPGEGWEGELWDAGERSEEGPDGRSDAPRYGFMNATSSGVKGTPAGRSPSTSTHRSYRRTAASAARRLRGHGSPRLRRGSNEAPPPNGVVGEYAAAPSR